MEINKLTKTASRSFPILIERQTYDQLDAARKSLIDGFIDAGLWKIIEKE